MLHTSLPHIMTDEEFQAALDGDRQLMICCGRNGPMCLPVYDVMENLQDRYDKVSFKVMPFDSAVSRHIRALPEVRNFMGLPFTVYFKDGKVVKATSSIQSKAQVSGILDEHFEA